MKFKPFIVVIFVLFILAACRNAGQIANIEREDLFALDIGRLEDQIAIFDMEGDSGTIQTDISMSDGLFYISDGNGGKILRFNSYGNLLFMIYNEETNPPPLTLNPLVEGSLVTRWAVSYPLLEPGLIAVDSRKHIYVNDRLPFERHSLDTENKALLDSVILHFDAEGRFVEYLGREGIGGSPLPRIERLYTNHRDDLAVVCRLPTGWNVYWYDSEGKFLFLVQLKNDAIPVPPDRDEVISSLDKICIGHDARTLFIKVDYYRYIYDESTNIRIGVEPDSSVIWILNAENGLWERYLEVPFYELMVTGQNRQTREKMLYSMLGVTRHGHIFLMFPVEDGYSILVLSSESGVHAEQRRGFMRVDHEELYYNVFDLSADGIISGLLADEWQVKLVWWRTDKIIREGF